MNPDVVALLRCPARDCVGDSLTLDALQTETIRYKDEPRQEIKEGRLSCAACGRSYPITQYVASFESVFSQDLKDEADHWGKWYGYLWNKGYFGYFDLRLPIAPLLTEGIEIFDPATLDHKDLGGSHAIIADHPLFKEPKLLLDIGCGTGWSSLYFRRRGHNVVAFDPSTSNMHLAKRYAISQSEYIEYIGAALGYLAFKPEVFDAMLALYSIHHVPELKKEMRMACRWLRPGGVIGVDEHVRNDPFLMALLQQMLLWAEEEVYPKFVTLDTRIMEGLPGAEPSNLEGAGSEDVIEAILENFVLEYFDSRYISLDSFSFMYYLSRYPCSEAYHYASHIIVRLYRFLLAAHPDQAELVTLIGRKQDSESPGNLDLIEKARRLAQGEPDLVRTHLEEVTTTLTAAHGELNSLYELLETKNKHIERLEQWATSMEQDLQKASQAGIPTRLKSRLKQTTNNLRKRVRRRKHH